ncbi:MAG: glycoside hydrolase family 10 protein [Bacteroidales bacterium]
MRFSRKSTFIFLFLFLSLFISNAQSKYDVRGVWFSTVWGLDFPTRPANTPATILRQKKELIAKLDSLQKININTLFFQVRNRGDLSYESETEPWHYAFGGKTGVSPGYDLLEFAIQETHKRGMEFHAWFVCMPLGSDKQIKDKKSLSLVARRPELCLKYKNEWYMNPAKKETAVYLAGLIAETTRKYDIDGVHLDYIRYPDRTDKYPDATFFKESKAKNLDQWRRDNITRIVSSVYDSVKKIKPFVKVSAAVIGRYAEESHNKPGWRGYEDVYQDAMKWFDLGKMDFITPMTYYQDPLFGIIVNDWCKRLKPQQIVPGLYTSMISPKERNWSVNDLFDQIMIARLAGAGGVAHFRAQPLIENTKHLSDMLATEHYRTPGVPYPATDSVEHLNTPAPPHIVCVKQTQDSLYVEWEHPDKNIRFNIYAAGSPDIATSEGGYLIKTNFPYRQIRLSCNEYPGIKYFVVTSADRYGAESAASTIGYPDQQEAFGPLFDK